MRIKINGAAHDLESPEIYINCDCMDGMREFPDKYMWNGMFQGKSVQEGHVQQGNKRLNEKRIHPTQKPVNLYRWIIQKYIKPGWRVLDTHVGSASSLIAFHEAGLRFVGFEASGRMYGLSVKRYREETAQLRLIDFL